MSDRVNSINDEHLNQYEKKRNPTPKGFSELGDEFHDMIYDVLILLGNVQNKLPHINLSWLLLN